MLRPRLISAWGGGASLAISSPFLATRAALLKPVPPVRALSARSYSQPSPRTTTTFNKTKPGQTAARAPRASTATNVITFLVVSSIGVGAYLYQWNKSNEGGILSSFSTPQGLSTEKWTPILLTNITKVTDQASIFEFQLPKPCVIPITSAIYVKDDEIQAMRAYTPIHSTEKEQDKIQFLIKRYGEGQVSRFIHSARPGKKIEMRGPVLIWPGDQHELEKWDEIGMIAGGTGITAMLPIIHSALTNPDKKVRISLLFAARSPEELYFKDELDQLSRTFSNQFRVAYTVDAAPVSSSAVSEWKGLVGYVDEKMLKGLMPAPNATIESPSSQSSKRSIILICGPEGMVKHVAGTRGMSGQEPVRGVLGTMGYQKDQVFRFAN